MDVLVFELAGARYGLPAADVQEIVRAVTISRLHHAPEVVAGVINVHGAVVPVVDMRARFGLAASDLSPLEHFIIVGKDRKVALRVDRALELVPVEEGLVREATGLADGNDSVAGIALLPDGLTVVHDPARFLSHAEMRILDKALDKALDKTLDQAVDNPVATTADEDPADDTPADA